MNWDSLDFLVFGGMIGALALIIIMARRNSRSPAYRFAMALTGVGAFLVAWINGAVGIIGNEENAANLLFFGVLGVGAFGALLARFRASGMAKTLWAMVLAQGAVTIAAVTLDLGAGTPAWPRSLYLMTTVFMLFWLSSAILFGRAARAEQRWI
ncbi:MAG: hypothetical protein AAF917_14650 [Pseudomonadota bacterium]